MLENKYFERESVLKFNRSVYQSLTMIGQFGINMLVPVFLCSFLGIFLDKKLNTSYLVIFLFFIGAAAGFRNVYRFAKSIYGQQSDESAYLHGQKKDSKEKKDKTGKSESKKVREGKT